METNNRYNQRLSTDFKFALGIDNGVAELATLGSAIPIFKEICTGKIRNFSKY